MFYGITKQLLALLAVTALLGLTACGNMPAKGAPGMIDYSYVPKQATGQLTVLTAPGIEAF